MYFSIIAPQGLMLSGTKDDVVILKEIVKSYILTGIQLFHLTSLEVHVMIFSFCYFFLSFFFKHTVPSGLP